MRKTELCISKNRDHVVDLMRGISILLVLVHHFHLSYRLENGFFADLFSADLMRNIGRNGNYGVTIFFVISGFLITSTTLSRFGELKHVNLRSFYSFRFARVIPNLFLMLGIVVTLSFAGVKIFQNSAGRVSLGLTVLSILTFTHNVLMQKFGWFNYCLNTLWSLSIEEVFYLGFPLVCLLLRKTALIAIAWSSLVVIAPFYRASHIDNDITALHSYLACFDGIAIGCITALLARHMSFSSFMREIITALATAAIVFVYFRGGILHYAVFGVSSVAFLSGVILLVKRKDQPSNRGFLSKLSAPVRWFGKSSYELYLFHIVILAFMRTLIKRDDMTYALKPIWFVLFIALSALAAEIVSRLYSEPLNRKFRALLASSRLPKQPARSVSSMAAAE